MSNTQLRNRTKQFALRVIKMSCKLPKDDAARVLGRQALRSGTSVAANFREATRARSDAEFVSKLGIVEQELDETQLWLELLVEADFVTQSRMAALLTETDELLRIVVASIRTTKKRLRTKKRK